MSDDNKTYEIPGTGLMAHGPASHEKVVNARHAFSQTYAKSRGWGDLKSLTWDQIMEIRKQGGWKSAGSDDS